MPVKTEEYSDEEPNSGLYVLLKFTFPKKYPDEIPILEIEEEDNLEEEGVKQEFMDFMKGQVIQRSVPNSP